MTDTDSRMHRNRTADREILERRAHLLRSIRRFMDERSILEVETPSLSRFGNTDPQINSLVAQASGAPLQYLHTSPEFAMKRLLAGGSGSIYQICRVFRNDPGSPLHRREFTMLEWYRTGFDHHDLMDEICDLLEALGLPRGTRLGYAEAFRACCGLDPHAATLAELRERAREAGLGGREEERSILLDFLFSHLVMPGLGVDGPMQIFDFPACQAALARVRGSRPGLAERFELFINGIEIANGYNELNDYSEVKSRFEKENETRRRRGLEVMPVDEMLLEALRTGLPPCAGVALGLDRLLMTLCGRSDIREVTAVPGDRD